MLKPSSLTDRELILAVLNDPEATELEKELAKRLQKELEKRR
ncbi:MAG: hypothetical protein WAU10_10240 [Caldilineaceae bacterium]